MAAIVLTAAVVSTRLLSSSHDAVPTGRRTTSAATRRPVLHPPSPIPGYLLIADRGNDRMLLVDASRRIYWRYPSSASATAMPFRFDDDTFFGPRLDRIVSNQEDQDTIQVISFPGRRVLWRYGHPNVKSGSAGYLNTPDDAYLLPNGSISVADAYNCRVVWISPAHRILRQIGTTGVCRHDPPRSLGPVNGATPLAGGGTLVSEIPGSWIDDFGPTGRLRWAVQAPVTYPSDPQLIAPDRILLADYAHPGAAVIMTRTGRVLWKYAPTSGPGELDHPSLALRIAPGLIAINDDYRDRVVLVSIRRHRIVWQYGHTDRPGTGPGFLNTPDGLDLLTTGRAERSRRLVRLLSAGRPRRRPAASAQTRLRISTPYRLPAPVEREVAVADRGAVVLAGGLAANGASTDGVFRLDPSSGVLTQLGSLPQPFHDAAGAVLGRRLFVFGGGSATSTATVQAFDLTTRRGEIVGRLPTPLSDVSLATVGGAAYLVGGFDGRRPRREIYRTTDGRHFTVAARLPIGLRYPAVAAVGSDVVIAGGTAAAGTSDRVFVFRPSTRAVTSLGPLPTPIAHAAAVSAGGSVYLLGGVGPSGAVRSSMVEIDPRSGRISRLRGGVAVRDAGVVQLPAAALVIGGATETGATSAVRRVARG